MTDWAAGDECEVVQCDPGTKKPVMDGEVRAAVIEQVYFDTVRVRFANLTTMLLYRDSGWRAAQSLTEMFGWRLMPPPGRSWPAMAAGKADGK